MKFSCWTVSDCLKFTALGTNVGRSACDWWVHCTLVIQRAGSSMWGCLSLSFCRASPAHTAVQEQIPHLAFHRCCALCSFRKQESLQAPIDLKNSFQKSLPQQNWMSRRMGNGIQGFASSHHAWQLPKIGTVWQQHLCDCTHWLMVAGRAFPAYVSLLNHCHSRPLHVSLPTQSNSE